MDLMFLSETFDFIGKMVIIFMALGVHNIIRRERKIDYHIICKMKREKMGAYVGVLFLAIAYILQLYIKYN